MTSDSPSRALPRIAIVLLVVLVSALGFVIGTRMRGRTSTPPVVVEETVALPAALEPGRTFPQVPVVTESGADTTTHALLTGHGKVVIFIDVECHPCSLMTARVQRLIDAHELASEQVLGITNVGAETIRSYKGARQLTFPIYSDPTAAFQREYQVMRYPVRLVVGPSLVIHEATLNANEDLDPARARSELAQ